MYYPLHPKLPWFILARLSALLVTLAWGIILVSGMSDPDGVLLLMLFIPFATHFILTIGLYNSVRWMFMLFFIILIPQIAIFGSISVDFIQDWIKGRPSDPNLVNPHLLAVLYTILTLIQITLLIAVNKCYHAFVVNTSQFRGFQPILKPSDPQNPNTPPYI